MKDKLKDLAFKAGVEYIRTRGNRALVRVDAYTPLKLVDRSWLEQAVDELDFYKKGE